MDLKRFEEFKYKFLQKLLESYFEIKFEKIADKEVLKYMKDAISCYPGEGILLTENKGDTYTEMRLNRNSCYLSYRRGHGRMRIDVEFDINEFLEDYDANSLVENIVKEGLISTVRILIQNSSSTIK